MSIECYSRDPDVLFSSYIVSSESRANGIYRKVAFKCSFDKITQGKVFFIARVDWSNGTVSVYENEMRWLNKLAFCTTNLPSVPPRSHQVYAKEAFGFFLRGHSFLHPECRCRPDDHYFHDERAREVGFTYPCENGCLLPKEGRGVTLHEMAKELAVRNLQGEIDVRDKMRNTLLSCLTSFGGMLITAKNIIWSPLCCVPDTLDTVEHIMQGAKILYPGPLLLKRSTIKKDLMVDLERLNEQRVIHILQSDKEGVICVFFENNRRMYMGVNQDVSNLWGKVQLYKDDFRMEKRQKI